MSFETPVRVFLVEDDLDFAELIGHAAEMRPDWTLIGHATSLESAISEIGSTQPDVVLLDLKLPDSDGTGTVEAIVDRFHPLAIVVLTSLDATEAYSSALRAGAQDYLDKAEATPAVLSRTVRYARERASYAATIAKQQKEIADFATHAAHDLSAPLRSMRGFAELLDEELQGRLQGDEQEFLGHIVSSAKRLQGLISDLMEYARAGHGEESAPVDLAEVVEHVLGELGTVLHETGTKVVVSELPIVFGQASALRQALRNLIANAIKFSGDEKPRVEIRGRVEADHHVVEVRDNGIGIEARFLEKILQPFSRLHGQSEYPGSGLGLAVVDRIVQRHSGRMRVESEVGVGSVFMIELPCELSG
ncbi:MAG: ATP-binding protein [Nannocystales bacterium]